MVSDGSICRGLSVSTRPRPETNERTNTRPFHRSYILCAFNSSDTNTRKDSYGGALAGRTKILFDVIDGIRKVTRPDFQLGLRLSPERFGMQMAEQIELVKILLEQKNLDYIDMSLWDCFKAPVEKAYAHKPLIDW
jgi:2,4-dienoyl-CoA reductase-like NADH-dependent reductase (Old Yellow Enzyme family)